MSGPGARKPLAQLVGSQCCEDGLAGPHSQNIADVLGQCEHGHGVICEYDESLAIGDCRPMKVCGNHWRYFTSLTEKPAEMLSVCPECDHPCAIEVVAEWPNGNTMTLRYTPQGNHQERKVS